MDKRISTYKMDKGLSTYTDGHYMYLSPYPRPTYPLIRVRPRKRGPLLPTPRKMLDGRCRKLQLDIYGRRDTSRVVECIARCHTDPARPLKVVAVHPLSG